ncbi:MAG TPA: DNA-binding response regulator [bacterium]|nr:DNA-binding response regulator [bacterium]
MANVIIYFHDPTEGAALRRPVGDGVNFTMARGWDDLSGRLSEGRPCDLIILEGAPTGLKPDLARRIKKIKDIPVLFFEEKKPEAGPSAGAECPPQSEVWKEAAALACSADPMEKARQFMDDNFREQLTLDQIAAVAGISASYFCRRFKGRLGESPITYLRNLRIARASYLLEHTSLQLAEITQQSGFFSVSYFCREFKKAIGISPIQHRRESGRKKV